MIARPCFLALCLGRSGQRKNIMRIATIRVLRGPSLSLDRPVLQARIELEELTAKESHEVAGFPDRLLAILLGLRQHPCAKGKAGDFVERLTLIDRDIRRTGKEEQLGPKESTIRHPA